MRLQSKYFGVIDYEPEECLSFVEALFGFGEEKQFLLLPFAGSENTMLCMQSVRTPSLAFIVMDPFYIKPDYEPELTAAELKSLGVKSSRELCYYTLCVVKKPIEQSTINLKCPIAINPQTLAARQIILESDAYEMRHLLSAFGKKEE